MDQSRENTEQTENPDDIQLCSVISVCSVLSSSLHFGGASIMKNRVATTLHRKLIVAAALIIAAAITLSFTLSASSAQDRLKTMPGYEQFQKMSPQIQGSFVSGQLNVTWVDGGKAFTYTMGGKAYRYSIAEKTANETGDAPANAGPGGGRGGPGGRGGGQGQGQRGQGQGQGAPPARGRQYELAISPDGKIKAFYRDRNLWLSDANGSNELAVTKDGNEKERTKYGTGSWVYGEELGQNTAMWWSPDSQKLAFYRFDESPVKDFFLQMSQTQVQSALDVEAYPKAGAPNPIAEVLVYDLASKQTVKLDVRDGKPFENNVVGHYVYNIQWSPDGTEILMNRTNRRQQILEFTACNPSTGKCRVIVREEWLTGWTSNRPGVRWLGDKKRFIWESERNGWRNLYLYDVSGKLITPLTQHTTFEVGSITKIDETAGVVFYTARSGDNHMKMQLHRVGLDGKGDVRLTDPAFNHTVSIAPDNQHFVDVYQTHKDPPATRLLDANGKVVAELAKSDLTKFNQLSLKKVEMFTFKAADGQTTLYGLIHFPSNFDPNKKYPVLVPVYGGPASASNTARETFSPPSAMTEYGFLVVNVDSRAAPGRGKRMLDTIYLKLGVTEMDDMAAGIKSLWNRPYFDKNRVGIYGTSYGGYTSALSILRHPDVYAAAAASSAVTSWYHYDSIYTERYMWIPQENKEGYEAGNAMNFADKLKGRLMIYYGTADNNVHPNNSMQLIQALQRAGKSFEVQVGPDRGHTGIDQQRMMEFFIENLAMRPVANAAAQ
jgi:dipeptidyl-peptidase-4